MRTYKKGQIHHEIATLLLSGNPMSPEDIISVFTGTKREKNVSSRLSTHIWNIKMDGGVIKVNKDGRKVQSYQLLNTKEFNDKGFYVGKVEEPANV